MGPSSLLSPSDELICLPVYSAIQKKLIFTIANDTTSVNDSCFQPPYNDDSAEDSTKFEMTDDGQTIVVVCTPLMRHVHKMWQFQFNSIYSYKHTNVNITNMRQYNSLYV